MTEEKSWYDPRPTKAEIVDEAIEGLRVDLRTTPTADEVVALKAGKPVCPHCSLTDVSFERTCHNSACPSYAHAETVCEGWKDSPPAADAGEVRHRLCLLIEDKCPDKDDHCGLAIGSEVEALADAILSLLSPTFLAENAKNEANPTSADIAQVAPGFREGVEASAALVEAQLKLRYDGTDLTSYEQFNFKMRVLAAAIRAIGPQ